MTLLSLIILLVVAGVGLYLLNTLVPMDAKIKRIINVLVTVVLGVIALVWLLTFLGVDLDLRGRPTSPRLR